VYGMTDSHVGRDTKSLNGLLKINVTYSKGRNNISEKPSDVRKTE